MAIRPILIAAALACASVAALPTLHAQSVTTPDVLGTCDPTQSVHAYYLLGAGPGNPDGWTGGFSEENTLDDCSQYSVANPDAACIEGLGLPCTSLGDYDLENGIGSAD